MTLKYPIGYGVLSSAATVAYVWWYMQVLSLPLSFSNVLFSLGVFATFIGLVLLSKNKLWRGSLFFLVIIFMLMGLGNVGYYAVYQSFFSLFGSWGSANVPVSFLVKYIFLIPVSLIGPSLVYVMLLGYGLLSLPSWKEVFRPLHFCQTQVQQKHLTWQYMSVGVLFILQVVLIGVTVFWHTSPKDAWAIKEKKMADIGFFGALYLQTFDVVENTINISSVFATEGIDTVISPPYQPETPYEQMRYNIHTLANLAREEPLTFSSQEQTSINGYDDMPNIIFYQLESIPSWPSMLKDNPLKFLNGLQEQHITADHFIPNSCYTINAEYSSLCSALSNSEPIANYGTELAYECLPSILKQRHAYDTKFYHSNESDFWSRDVFTKKWGFDETYFVPYFENRQADQGVIDAAIDHMATSTNPVFSYITGFTSHSPHYQHFIDTMQKTGQITLPEYTSDIPNEIVSAMDINEKAIQMYMWYVKAVDDAIHHLFERIAEEGLQDNTLVVIYGDHRYYGFPEHTKENFFRYNDVPFVIVTPDQLQKKTAYASHIDIAPTVLHLLEGKNYRVPEQFIGTSILSDVHPNNAVLRCSDEVHLVDDQVVVTGSSKDDIYTFWYTLKQTDADINEYRGPLKSLLQTQDTLLKENRLVPSYEAK